ncbi:MAG: translation elongation factor, partial [Firmicutes bacterium]|nr:translation elongation factor [Bacillota bacterium]
DILSNYQGFKKCILILVFDAYKVKGGPGEVMDYHNIHVVYTKEAETADQYIEKVTHDLAKEHRVTVATSDALVRTREQIRRDYLERQPKGRAYLGDAFTENILDLLEEEEN